ncbi:succinylglutamate desuccinylase [Klebsiella sp. BIGb0407]|uniref:succinylglutamate desuccinylase n=1 Tax=Klebsiella sp. BIGb0407 TaxID=2940603 RepID=UPI0021681B3C|nr:succinylglutamate desuccinylase [Klebsiella sp. BIGb0407]MCS3429584.1 succinylglutamate desuccinylase [Klebsiella sp. BIGb0407]
MGNFLTQTLAGGMPPVTSGSNLQGTWQWWDEGILTFTPRQKSDQALLLSAGIHGNETAPVELLMPWVDDLLAGKVPVAWRLMVILGNPAALAAQKRYLQSDLNRMFGGRWQSFPDSPETQRALLLEQAVTRFWDEGDESRRWHLDMHTAIRESYHPRFGVLPFREMPYEADFLNWLGDAGLEALVFHQQPAGTFSHFTSEYFKASSCTLELGKARRFGENELEKFATTKEALYALLAGVTATQTHTPPQYYRVSQQITRTSERFILHMSDDTRNFTAFTRGTCLAEDGITQSIVQKETEYVLFPNPGVALGLRAGLMLEKI